MKKAVFHILSILLAAVTAASVFVSCYPGVSDRVGTSENSGTVNTGGPAASGTDVGKDTAATGTSNPADPDPVYESDPGLVITEIMIGNNFTAVAPDGGYHPWIEFLARYDCELSDYTLTYCETKQRLPEKALKAGEYFLLFAYGDGLPFDMSVSAVMTLMHGEEISQKFTYINRSENCSYLVEAGCETSTPTPMYADVRDPDMLVISEIMSSNSAFPIDGVICDWIEIFNAGETDLLLSDYFASDKPEKPYLNRLPEKTLASGEYAVLACGRDLDFNLSKDGDTVVLTRKDGVLSSLVSFGEIPKNRTYTPDGVCETPSPGYENGYDGMIAYVCSRSGLLINEVLSSNSTVKAPDGDYCDVIELVNLSDEDIRLSDYYITDKPSDLTKLRLPDVILKLGEYYAFYCTKDTGFSVSKSGERLMLSREDGYVSDSVVIPELMHDISYGRYDSDLVYFETPTFGKANTHGLRYVSSVPEVSIAGGNYTGPVSLTLSGDGDIYYTTDGSKPTLDSKKYEGEQIGFDSVGTLRAICKKGEQITSPELASTYFIGIPEYELPVIMVNIDDDLIFGETGVYTTEKKTELEARASYYKDGAEQFSVGCGIKLFGNGSIKFPKKSFQLKFKTKYGASKLEYDVFEDGEITEFDSLVIRSGAQGMYRCLMNDEFVTSFIQNSGNMPTLLTQKFRPVNFYINEQYMGIYFLREKIDEDFIAAHTGVSPESVSVVFRMQFAERGTECGDFFTNIAFARDNDLRIKENYEIIKEHFDVENIIDFFLNAIWCGNIDTLNVRMYRSSEGDGRWRFILFDVDRAFYYNYASASLYLKSYNLTTRPYSGLLYKLLQNEEFYALFYERLDLHVKNTFDPEKSLPYFEYMMSLVDHDMIYEIERWKDDDSAHPQTYQRWYNYCTILKNRLTADYNEEMVSLINTRVAAILKDTKVNKPK